MNIQAFKLVTGEDVLAEVSEQTETEFTLRNPVGIAVVRGQQGPQVGFAPFPLHSDHEKSGKTITLDKRHVVYYYTPADDFVSNYSNIFGSGIVVPPEKKLILS